jgi:uncharacterized protein YyaL (SSP411 family)
MFRFSPRPNRAHLVAWRAWGEDAFRQAREQGKPVALFITAFWCGFCQRLDETTLSNDDVIALLNAYFIPIRVEESQRPDVDLRYNQDGWPTIAFLTPGGDHLFSVNYLAPEAFVNLLVRVVSSAQGAGETTADAALQPPAVPSPRTDPEDTQPLGPALVAEIAGMVEGLADPVHGGYGAKDKFLHTEANEFLLYLFETTGERAYLDHVLLTLDTMRRSRTFDATDGGFFRYSSRRDWQEPHPEKLLDDQAALLGNALHAFLLTEAPAERETAAGLIDYLNTTLRDPDTGLFFGCQDYVRPEFVAGRRGPPDVLSVIDTYLYCDANARTASAYLHAWWLLGDERCCTDARQVLRWLWAHLRALDGGMMHYWDGEQRVPGLLMDAVMMGRALLDGYAFLGDPVLLDRAKELADSIVLRHRNPAGGFYDIAAPGPAALQFPMTVLQQNAVLADFFRALADLSGERAYRNAAYWALTSFPNAHRQYGAFAAGFGHALARLLAPPVFVTLTGAPGDPRLRELLRVALTGVRPQNPALRFRAGHAGADARIEIGFAGGLSGPITNPAELTPELLATLSQAQ